MKINGYEFKDFVTLANDLHKEPSYYREILSNEDILLLLLKENREKYKKIVGLIRENISDSEFVFQAGLILNQFMPFNYSKMTFKTLEELGCYMLKTSPMPNLIFGELLKENYVSFFIVHSSYIVKDKEYLNKVEEIEQEAKVDIIQGYWDMAYFLSKCNNFIFDNAEYKNLYNFVFYSMKNNVNIKELGDYLKDSELVKAYLKYSEHDSNVDEFYQIIERQSYRENELKKYLKKKRTIINEE